MAINNRIQPQSINVTKECSSKMGVYISWSEILNSVTDKNFDRILWEIQLCSTGCCHELNGKKLKY